MARTSWTEANTQAFEALSDQLIDAACDDANGYPLGGLTAQQRTLLVDGFDWDEISAEALLQRWATALGGRRDIRSVNPAHRSLHAFKRKGTSQRRTRLAQEENALAVAEAAMMRRNRPSTRGVPQDALDAEQMINSGSGSLVALGYLLRERPGRLWYDEFYCTIRLDWRGDHGAAVVPAYEINDATILRIIMWLRSLNPEILGDVSRSTLEDALKAAADRDTRNEPQAWLKSLEWDGVERLPDMMHRIFRAPQTKLNRCIGSNLLIGMVARILKPGCKLDTMVVLRGGQGLNKSTACSILGGPWYAQSHANVDTKDFVQELRGLMVLEVAELHSFLASRTGAARVKAMLTVENDRYRPVWGRTVQTFPRTVSSMGTTNDKAILNDPTGARRYMIVDTPQLIDLETLRAERDQLFAEAVVRYKAGAKWWEFPEHEHREMADSATAVNYFQERLEELLDEQPIYDGVNRLTEEIVDGIRRPALEPIAPSVETVGDDHVPAQWGTLLTTHRCAHWLKLSPRDAETGQNGRKLQEALRGMGFEAHRLKVAPDRKVVRAWLRVRASGLTVKRAGLRGEADYFPF